MRKVVYIIAACLILGVGISATAMWLHPPRTFRVVSMDGVGGGGLGFGGRGLGCSMKTWRSSDGFEVFEESIAYANADEARKDFEEELKTAKVIYQQTDRPDYRRVIGTFAGSNSDKPVKMIRLEGEEIRYAEASSLESLLLFDRSWFKFDL